MNAPRESQRTGRTINDMVRLNIRTVRQHIEVDSSRLDDLARMLPDPGTPAEIEALQKLRLAINCLHEARIHLGVAGMNVPD